MFNPALHNPIRTNIVSFLSKCDEASFKELKTQLDLTDGNLNSHLKALSKEEYIDTKKFFDKNRPKTVYSLNKKGSEEFLKYLDQLQLFLESNASS
ncbi:MAG: transcriptional regulator [Campylobacterales bacterium]|nr:transcriptional regulator [Campylobacterales bacterium]